MSDETRYAYAVARIRAIEKKLLDKGKLERMVEARTAEDAMKVLIEADYGYTGGETLSAYEYERLLKEEYKKVYKLLREVAPNPQIFDVFMLKNDYHNAKVILKGEFSGNNDDSILIDSGTINPGKLRIMIRDRKMSDMPVIMRRAVEECVDSFNRTGDPQVIDLIMDRAAFMHMKDEVKNINEVFLKDLIVILIDLANINIFLRVKKMNKNWDFLQKTLLPGGSISEDAFVKNLQDTLENFINSLRFTPYGQICEDAITNFNNTGSLSKFEKLSDNFVINYLKKAHYKALGLEPLVGYIIAKEMEIKNARIVMSGKINNISSDIIRERLREAYV